MKTLNVLLAILVGGVLFSIGLSNSMAAEKPKPGGTFVVGMHADPQCLNPMITTELTMRLVAANIFSRLVYTDQEGYYQGDLAEKWSVSPDNLKIKFELRKGAKWHDGKPVTAEDVKFSLESLQKYNPRGLDLKQISEITVLNDTTLEIRFPSVSVSFFPFLNEAGVIIPKHVYSTAKDLNLHPLNNNPVGSGPFIFKEWKKAEYITLEKNKNYYIPGEPFFDKVVFKIIPSSPSRVLALETGEVDYLSERGLPEVDALRLQSNPNFVVTDHGMGASSLTSIYINTRRKPLNDIRVRQAIAHTIDRKVMIEKAMFGLGEPAYSPFSKKSWPWAYNPKVEEMYPRDLAKAAKLLDEAGYPVGSDGVRFTTTVIFDRAFTRTADMSEIFREQLKKVNINIVLLPMEKAAMSQRVWMGQDFDLFLGQTSQGTDPATGIERIFSSKFTRPVTSAYNVNEYSNPEVDKLFSLARSTIDLKKRGQYYREVQPIIMKDLPMLPLVDNPSFAAFPKKVRGVNQRRFYAYYCSPSDGWFSE